MTTCKDMLMPLIESGMTVLEFIEKCKKYENETLKNLKDIPPEYCPVNLFAFLKFNIPCRKVISGISYCPVCGNPMCPDCYNHNVAQISRVTGYMSDVSGWNNAKKQELKDRKRYEL